MPKGPAMLKPPRPEAWLLRRLIDSVVRDQALGDLEERFRFEARQRRLLRAWAVYWIQIRPDLKSII